MIAVVMIAAVLSTIFNIVGPKVYTKGIQKKIEKAELKTYNKNLLNIKLI